MIKIGLISDYSNYKKIEEYYDEICIVEEYRKKYFDKYKRNAPKNTKILRDIFIPREYNWIEVYNLITEKYGIRLVSLYRNEKYFVLRFYWIDEDLKTIKMQKQDIHSLHIALKETKIIQNKTFFRKVVSIFKK